jgi:outer membrane protein OmpA-like peptidoglycan-associated protein
VRARHTFQIAFFLLVAGANAYAQGTGSRGREDTTAAETRETPCTCTSVPFLPDPPCANQCTRRILETNSASALTRSLKLEGSVRDALMSLKDKPVTDEAVAAFARTKEGAAFSSALQAANVASLAGGTQKRLVAEAVLSESAGNFKFGSSALPADAKLTLDQLVSNLKSDRANKYFEIEGHTDNLGGKDAAQKVGLERAEAVKKYLYEQYQIPLHHINVLSYGAEKPVAPNKTKDGRAQNRRVVVRVLDPPAAEAVTPSTEPK